MAKDVKIRLSLDLAQSRADLAAFYGLLRSAPPISPGGVAPPGYGPGGGGPGGGPGVGTIAAGVATGNALTGILRSGWNANGFRQAREAILEEAKWEFFGVNMPKVAGAFAARDDVAGRYGKLYGMGIVDLPFMRQMQGLSDQFGAGMQARGEAMARRDLGTSTVASVWTDVATIVATEMGQKFVEVILAKMGGGLLGRIF